MKEKFLAILSKANNVTLAIIAFFIIASLITVGYFCPDAIMKIIEGIFG